MLRFLVIAVLLAAWHAGMSCLACHAWPVMSWMLSESGASTGKFPEVRNLPFGNPML